MPLSQPITPGQHAFAVLPVAAGYCVQRVAVQEAYHGGEVFRALDADPDGEVYGDPTRILAAEMIHGGEEEARAGASAFNLLGPAEPPPALLSARLRGWAADHGLTLDDVAAMFGIAADDVKALSVGPAPADPTEMDFLAAQLVPADRVEPVAAWLLELCSPFPDEG